MAHMSAQPTALTADQVGAAIGGARPIKAATIRAWYRSGRFPAPIDPTLPVKSWRWSPRIVGDYIDGAAA